MKMNNIIENNKNLTLDQSMSELLKLKIDLITTHNVYKKTRNERTSEENKIMEDNIKIIRSNIIDHVTSIQINYPLDMDEIYYLMGVPYKDALEHFVSISFDIHNDIVLFHWMKELKGYSKIEFQ